MTRRVAITGVVTRRLSHHSARMRGFTLLELLVAVSIFAVIGVMAYGGLQNVLNQQQQTALHADRLKSLQVLYQVMQRDLEQIIARSIRNEYGDVVGPLVGGSGFNGVEFSRAGYGNPGGFLRSEIQRVAYLPDQDRLLRRSWRVLDRAQDSQADEQVLTEHVVEFAMRFLDENREWQENWPPLSTQGGVVTILPLAIEVKLELDDVGALAWMFRLPATPVAPTPTLNQRPGGETSPPVEDDQSGGLGGADGA